MERICPIRCVQNFHNSPRQFLSSPSRNFDCGPLQPFAEDCGLLRVIAAYFFSRPGLFSGKFRIFQPKNICAAMKITDDPPFGPQRLHLQSIRAQGGGYSCSSVGLCGFAPGGVAVAVQRHRASGDF